MTELYEIEGSWGTITVTEGGAVVALTNEPDVFEPNETGYRMITHFDVIRYEREHGPFKGCDILDIGYWTNKGEYEPPIDRE